MRFFIAASAALATTAVQGAAITSRDNTCPKAARNLLGWPQYVPYKLCCAYNVLWGQCCQLDGSVQYTLGDKPVRKCTPDFVTDGSS
ncbi:hypothetical protein PtrSN002B_012176 [Pyrenophora tritici-repentis]|uniref:Uncharacterized protein n=2 Tax=Pyrenophora tritici-repentis TaxID=45151 RepID=A0A2W1CL78_9PLEO|nr:uncharacterized protein PTRG_11088 [Pyrenophora tritici-repentis Pt-1C-BFP]KAA8622218.1 hypothetical protein PtrV1_03524 [Pyrenophora tritici-repentis]EDU44138.1 predicted protein [Pyrenophora tritici-repentis Pt-1C-BFP]KAF7451198.1 hypothetical protein A1F99_029750 [Pyrenophora tritici-repentis]KAF7575692.1 hypothetical protein PtrM4_073160 [Pyrenophora tritici-repentis]KAG9385572.1 hypothetical protein A1F94_002322 [Pyrenophora tritici-repentis]